MAAIFSEIGPYLQNLFKDKLITDEREAIFEFTIPGFSDNGEKFGLFAPEGELFKQLILFIIIQIPCHCFFAVIIYKFIVQNRKNSSDDKSNDKNGSSTETTPAFTYLLGWGVIIPIVCVVPYHILEYLDIRNKIIKLAATNFMSNVFFRCIEAMYGTTPHSAVIEKSVYHYMSYYTTGASFVWDDKTCTRKKLSLSKLVYRIGLLVLHYHLLSLHLSFLMHYNYKPLDDPVELDQFNVSTDLFTTNHLVNSYLHCLLTYLVLFFGFEGTAFSENAKGFETVPIFKNPLFASKTPTDFWTKRWNLMTHSNLKHGIFLPARQFMNSKLALFFTFIISGVYHDYAWSLVFYHQSHFYDENGHCHHGCFVPVVGQLTSFFLYTGVIMLLERPLGKLPVFQWMSKNLPTIMKATLLVIIHLPFTHWYYGDWIEGGYFNDFAIALWHIKKL